MPTPVTQTRIMYTTLPLQQQLVRGQNVESREPDHLREHSDTAALLPFCKPLLDGGTVAKLTAAGASMLADQAQKIPHRVIAAGHNVAPFFGKLAAAFGALKNLAAENAGGITMPTAKIAASSTAKVQVLCGPPASGALSMDRSGRQHINAPNIPQPPLLIEKLLPQVHSLLPAVDEADERETEPASPIHHAPHTSSAMTGAPSNTKPQAATATAHAPAPQTAQTRQSHDDIRQPICDMPQLPAEIQQRHAVVPVAPHEAASHEESEPRSPESVGEFPDWHLIQWADTEATEAAAAKTVIAA